MAANPKRLRVIEARSATASTRVLEIECVEGGAFDSIGGKYVIVHTGLMIGEKAVKRAYSLMPVAGHPGRAAIAVKLLSGPGSRAMHALTAGTTLGFSGPWGKLIPEAGLAPRTLLIATDTGITSALGIIEQWATAGGASSLSLTWLHDATDAFLDVPSVRSRAERAGAAFSAHDIAPVATEARGAEAWPLIEAAVRRAEASLVVATGDGRIVHSLRELLPARLGVSDVRCECFFNNPEKKSA